MMGICARAPGKVILFGEHAINRGQPAIAAAVGLYASCRLTLADRFIFCAGDRRQETSSEKIQALTFQINQMRNAQAFEQVRALAASDYFAPQKYVLGTFFGQRIPGGLRLEWKSQIPSSSGLGSGGAAFTAMVAALTKFSESDESLLQRAERAQLGDIIAHGGVASGLDTQTSLLGGVIWFHGQGLAEAVPCAPGAKLIVANSGMTAATSEINTRVRLWLAEKPESRMPYFHAIGALSRAARPLLENGGWDELGRLMNLNQFVLERIGVSTPLIDDLIDAARSAGAYGAKISGSGGGGIIIVLASEERKESICAALRAAGAEVLIPDFAVAGAAELNSWDQTRAVAGQV